MGCMAAAPSTTAATTSTTTTTTTTTAPVYLPITPKLEGAKDVALSPDNAFFLVSDWRTVIHVDTNTNTATRAYKGFSVPWGIAISPDTSFALVADFNKHNIERKKAPHLGFEPRTPRLEV